MIRIQKGSFGNDLHQEFAAALEEGDGPVRFSQPIVDFPRFWDWDH